MSGTGKRTVLNDLKLKLSRRKKLNPPGRATPEGSLVSKQESKANGASPVIGTPRAKTGNRKKSEDKNKRGSNERTIDSSDEERRERKGNKAKKDDKDRPPTIDSSDDDHRNEKRAKKKEKRRRNSNDKSPADTPIDEREKRAKDEHHFRAESPTVFETISTNNRPALVVEKENKLLWKEKEKPREKEKKREKMERSRDVSQDDGEKPEKKGVFDKLATLVKDKRSRHRDRDNTQDGETADHPTVFERPATHSRPAVVPGKDVKLQWKDGCEPVTERHTVVADKDLKLQSKEGVQKDGDVDTTDPHFVLATKVMAEVRAGNVLETCLSPQENQEMRRFFESSMREYTQDTCALFNKALDICYNRLVHEQNEFSVYLDDEMKTFLMDKEMAKVGMMDVIMAYPNFVPVMWGGKLVEVSIDTDGKPAEPRKTARRKRSERNWTALMKKAIEEERKRDEEKKRDVPAEEEKKDNTHQQPTNKPSDDDPPVKSCYF